MKKLFIIMLLFILVFTVGCDKRVLNTKPLDKYTENQVWNNIDLANGFVYATYPSVLSLYTQNDAWTDNTNINGPTHGNELGVNEVSAGRIDQYFDAGWNKYALIRRCNIIIEKAGTSASLLPRDKQALVAQGYFLRAMIYFYLAEHFGRFMKIDTILTPEDNLKSKLTSSIKDSYDFIFSDIQQAINGLPDQAAPGLAAKAAAYVLEARVALQAAAYVGANKAAYYNMAKTACEKIFALHQYELDPDYEALFNDYNHALGSKEIILAWFRNSINTSFQSTPMQSLVVGQGPTTQRPGTTPLLTVDLQGWPSQWPSQQLVNSYLVVDADGKARAWDSTAYYYAYKSHGGYVSDAIYSHRDKRFYASIVYDSSMYFDELVTTRENGNMFWTSNTKDPTYTSQTGYMYRKGVYEATPVLPSAPTNYHYIIFRLGAVYLNYAEALLRLDMIPEAIDAINKTRTVHGGLPLLPANLSGKEAWHYYEIERRVELLQENDRYWSLLRWGMEAGGNTIPQLNETPQAIDISADGKHFNVILPVNASANHRLFTPRRYLFPIPEGEREANANLSPQNTGW